MKEWAKRFRDHMRRHNLSQEALAEVLEVSQGAVGHWLRGDREINLSDFWRLCDAAGADPRQILFGETSAQAALDTLKDKILTTNPDKAPSYPKIVKKITPRKHKARV